MIVAKGPHCRWLDIEATLKRLILASYLVRVGDGTGECQDYDMTTYNRRGHYRRGPNGQQVWVSSHTVSRSSGSSYSPPSLSPRSFVAPRQATPVSPETTFSAPFAPTLHLPQSIRWARPNAVCPVCGAFVYFYANEFGSRVYFDEIGPPWPKHPCTANVMPSARTSRDASRTTPTLYPTALGRQKVAKLSSNITPRAFTVLHEERQNKSATLFHLQRLYTESRAEVWETPANVAVEVGQLVFIDGGTLSYVDTEKAQVVRVAVRFLHRISGDSLLQRFRARWGR